jgi:hypothetical protein
MSGNSKEWIINGVLLAGIAGFLAVIGMSQFSGVDVQEPPSPTPIHTPLPGPPRPGTIESVYGPGQPDAFPLIGTTEIFRDLITPSPTPTPIPPPAAQTPSLQRAVKNWQYQYPNKRLKTYHFLEKGSNKEYDVKENEPLAVPDPVTRQDVQVKAKSSGKTNVILETPDGQTVEFSF